MTTCSYQLSIHINIQTHTYTFAYIYTSECRNVRVRHDHILVPAKWHGRRRHGPPHICRQITTSRHPLRAYYPSHFCLEQWQIQQIFRFSFLLSIQTYFLPSCHASAPHLWVLVAIRISFWVLVYIGAAKLCIWMIMYIKISTYVYTYIYI